MVGVVGVFGWKGGCSGWKSTAEKNRAEARTAEAKLCGAL